MPCFLPIKLSDFLPTELSDFLPIEHNDFLPQWFLNDSMISLVDTQKVQLLPRQPTTKQSLFRRLLTINQFSAPIHKSSKGGIGLLWHKRLAGRNGEDFTSAFFKVLNLPQFQDMLCWLFWLNNCADQNKCWTLFIALVLALDSDDRPDRITSKYFVSWHTFMSADKFHREIEEMKAMGKVYDFIDFWQCKKN